MSCFQLNKILSKEKKYVDTSEIFTYNKFVVFIRTGGTSIIKRGRIMKRKFFFGLAMTSIVILMAGMASAVPITVNFDDYPDFSPPRDDMAADESAWFNANYGITFDHLYMYQDSRDTIDGFGIASGWTGESGQPSVAGTVFFTEPTNFVTLDWWVIRDMGIFSVFDSSDVLLDSFSNGRGKGNITLSGLDISYLTLTGTGGFTGLSTLIYTDGKNVGTDPVPEPSSMFLLMSGLAGLAGFRRRFAR